MRVLGWVVAMLTACGGAEPMRLDPRFGETAIQAQTTRELRVYLGPGDTVRGLAVYHEDESLIPASIRLLGEKEFPGAAVAYYESEWHTGRGEVYEVEYDLGGGARGEVSATADGTLLYVERPLPLDTLPPAIRSAALARVPGELKGAESKRGPQLDQVELSVFHQGRKHVLVLSVAGEVLWHGLQFPAQVQVPLPLR